MTLHAAIAGTRWGLVHLHALRAHGAEVLALAGTRSAETRALAQGHGVPLGTADLSELRALNLDLLVIATPPGTHAAVAQAVGARAVLCEKPLQDAAQPAQPIEAFGPQCWVNYAFTHLAQARDVQAAGTAGLERVDILTEHDLGQTFTPAAAMGELASHPLAWVAHWLGAPVLESAELTPATSTLHLRCGAVPVSLTVCERSGINGLRHRVVVQRSSGQQVIDGAFRFGEPWAFALHHDATQTAAQTAALEPNAHAPCPWMQANQASVGLVLSVLRGELTATQAEAQGLVTAALAHTIDEAFRQALAYQK